jgi:hypothetical protein
VRTGEQSGGRNSLQDRLCQERLGEAAGLGSMKKARSLLKMSCPWSVTGGDPELGKGESGKLVGRCTAKLIT